MAQPTSPDPAIPIDDGSPDMDYQAHVRTFNAFLSTGRWFVTHLFILLIALYFGAIANQPGTAIALIGLSVALLIYGLLRRPSVRADVTKGLMAGPGATWRERTDDNVSEGDTTA
jgi:hypothetical protein